MPMQGGGTITLQQIRNEWEYGDQNYYIPNQGIRGSYYAAQYGAANFPAYPSYNLNAYRSTRYFYDAGGYSGSANFSSGTITIQQFYSKASYPAWNCQCDCQACGNGCG